MNLWFLMCLIISHDAVTAVAQRSDITPRVSRKFRINHPHFLVCIFHGDATLTFQLISQVSVHDQDPCEAVAWHVRNLRQFTHPSVKSSSVGEKEKKKKKKEKKTKTRKRLDFTAAVVKYY